MRFCLTFLYLFRREKKNPLNEDSLYNDILLTLKYGKNYFFQKNYIKIIRYS